MNERRNESPIENKNELIISEATMSKNITELQQEETQLVESVKNLTVALNQAKSAEEFKSINGKLTGSKDLLEEVRIALQIKKMEGVHDFTESVERENGGAILKMEKRSGDR